MFTRWLTLLLALALLFSGVMQLSGDLYFQTARISGWYNDLQRAAAAGAVATDLLQSDAPAYKARVAAIDGESQVLVQGYAQALRDAPASAYRWAELARALALVGDFGPHFDQAIQRAQQLAPRSPAVHLALADIRWRYGSELSAAQLDALLPSFIRTMRPHRRQLLLDRIVRTRRHPAFCAEYGAQFTGGRWCARIEDELKACETPAKLSKQKRNWCRRVEALP